jgi:hypothetical protein
MPAPLRIVLAPEAARTLSELRVASKVPQRTRDRAHMLRLNAQKVMELSALVQQQWERWAQKELLIFFLPKDCSAMNPIKGQWHQLKAHEIAGQIFEDQYDLAIAAVNGMEARSIQGVYDFDRFIFNSTQLLS